MTQQGVIKRWLAEKSFGFISPDAGGDDVFVHVSAVEDGMGLREGDRVSFETAPSERHPGKYSAVAVKVLTDAA